MRKKLKIKAKQNNLTKKSDFQPVIFLTAFIVICAFALLFAGINIVTNKDFLVQKGLNEYQNGNFQDAERYYNFNTAIKKLFCITLKSHKDKDFYSYFESKEEMIKCILESGNISKAITEYQKLLQEVQIHCPYDEEMNNLINLQIANCYSVLGLYKKSIPIYEKLRSWYPQNLIQAYLETKNYDKAKEILFSNDIKTKIEEGDDTDAVALGYILLNYYKAIGRYDLANKNYSNNAPKFETDITSTLNLAELNYIQKNYEIAEKLFEELLSSDIFSQNTKHKIQLKYASLLYEIGKSYQAEQTIENIFKEQNELYDLSPEIICTNYTASKIFTHKSADFLKVAQKKFDRLKLPAESIFVNNLEDFCKINTHF